jgi:hypothetical protein
VGLVDLSPIIAVGRANDVQLLGSTRDRKSVLRAETGYTLREPRHSQSDVSETPFLPMQNCSMIDRFIVRLTGPLTGYSSGRELNKIMSETTSGKKKKIQLQPQ